MSINVAYWKFNTPDIRVLGEGNTPNELGVVITSKFEDLQEALRSGVLYFKVSDKHAVPFQGTHLELAEFIEKLFHNYKD